MLCLGLQCDGHNFPELLTELGGAGLVCRIVCYNNVGDGGVDVEGHDGVNIWELMFWDVDF